MAILETVTISIGAAIAKRMVKTWLGDSLADDLVQLSLKKAESKLAHFLYHNKEASNSIDKLAAQVVDQMTPLLKQEARDLDQGTQQAVIRAVGDKLTEAEINARLIIRQQLNGEKLAQYLLEDRDHRTREFPEAGAIYDRLLHEISRRIVKITIQLDDYQRFFDKAMLTNQLKILEQIHRQQAEVDQAALAFEEKYRHAVIDELDRFEQFGIRRVDTLSSSQSLDMAYVTLSATIPVLSTREPDVERGVPMEYAHKEYLQTRTRSGLINQILGTSARFVIRGQAGSGKSTLLQWLAIRAAQQDFPDELAKWNECVPFFIRLREWVNKGFPNPKEFIEPVASPLLDTMPEHWVTDQLDRGNALVLIDGVDELPAEQRDDMLRGLRQLVRAYPFARYIVTSRPAAIKKAEWPEWQQWVEEQKFVDATLQPMTLDDIDYFIDCWHMALQEATSNPRRQRELAPLPAKLQRLLRNSQPLRRLAVSPLLCAMICALHESLGEAVPASRLELYRECVSMLLSWRDDKREVGARDDYPAIKDADKRFLVEKFAFWMLNNDYSDVKTAQVDGYFERELSGRHIPSENQHDATGESIRRLLVERANLLQEPAHERISFTHRTFLEYLAARAIIQGANIGVLLKHADDDQWRETFILVVGEAPEPTQVEILQKLLAAGDQAKRRYELRDLAGRLTRDMISRGEQHYTKLYLLAFACLETMTAPPTDLRIQIVEKAKQLIPPADDDEVALIAKAGEPAVELLHFNPDHAYEEMVRCVKTLARIGSAQAMQAVRAYVTSDAYNADEDIFESVLLRMAIGEAWFSFDRQQYLSLILSDVTQLDLSSTQVSDISTLSALANLQTLDLNFTQVSDISALSGLANLQTLWLDGTQMSDIFALSGLANLQTLSLMNTQVSDISALSGLDNLQTLSLMNTQVSDISALSGLDNLQYLYLNGTQVSDISALSGLANLRILWLDGTQVSDVSTLKKIKGLKIHQ